MHVEPLSQGHSGGALSQFAFSGPPIRFDPRPGPGRVEAFLGGLAAVHRRRQHTTSASGGGVRLRLIRQDVLICEVSDNSNTSPRLRHARTTDEGGRGLFLVARMARRWGTRYTAAGKLIWAEQELPAG